MSVHCKSNASVVKLMPVCCQLASSILSDYSQCVRQVISEMHGDVELQRGATPKPASPFLVVGHNFLLIFFLIQR